MANEKRLIDANELFSEIERRFCLNCNFFDGKCRECQYAEVADMLVDAPTVDAVEVVHGRWIHVPSSDMMTGKAYKCSECNKMRYGSFMPNYCQNCGAKMDGDNDV